MRVYGFGSFSTLLAFVPLVETRATSPTPSVRCRTLHIREIRDSAYETRELNYGSRDSAVMRLLWPATTGSLDK